MVKSSYTFRHSCNSQVIINPQNYFQVRRISNNEVFFSIGDFDLQNLHNKFIVKDHSTKWGFGERFQSKFKVTDGTWTLWNRDKPWKIDRGMNGISEQTYGHQPVYLARSTNTKLYHLAYFKNTFGLQINSINNSEEIVYHSVGGTIQFILVLGDKNPEEVLQRYHAYIGGSYIPPFWGLGWHQCRWGYKSSQILRDVVKKYRQNDIPIDVIWSDL